MKSYYRHILLTSAAILAAAACTKTVPEGPQVTDMQISICASEGLTKSSLKNGTFNPTGTKSLLDANTFAAESNRIQVYDYVDDAATPYINDQIGPDVSGSPLAEATAGVWPFVNGPHQWTGGTHKFFGWLAYDANEEMEDSADTPEEFFGSNFKFDEGSKTLTIPAKQMTATTPQFDFMYSDIFTTEPINSPVQLEFSHLFCAVSFGIINDGTSNVTLQKYTVTLYDNKSAYIRFSSVQPEVVYTLASNQAATFRSNTTSSTLQGMTTKPDAFDLNAKERKYLLMWPQTENNLQNCTLSVQYRKGTTNYTQNIKLDSVLDELEAGKKYHFDVSIMETQNVKINYLVVDWDEVVNDYTFE